MKIREITLGVSRTFNLQNYESFRTEASVTVALEEGDGIADVRDNAIAELRETLNAVYAALKPKKKESNDV